MYPFNLNSKGEFKISHKFLEEKDWEGKPGFEQDDDMRPSESRFEFRRFGVLRFLVIVCFLILGWRLFSLQILARDLYQKEAEGNRVRDFAISAARGIIYDTNGNLLVRNIPGFEVVFVPNDLPSSEEERDKLAYDLAGIINKDPFEIEKIFNQADARSFEPETLIRNLDRDKALVLDTKISSLPGINLIKNSIREYLGGEILSHILGYTGKISKEEYKERKDKGYFLTDWVGKQGVEYSYEEVLRGKAGRRTVEVDSQGKVKKVIGLDTPTAGKNLQLSLDLELENKLYQEVKMAARKAGSERAAAVALDPRTGRILALVSIPTYDNNLFAQGISPDGLQKLNQNPNKPLFNRVVGGEYPPGSTIKPMLAVAALEENIISPNHFLSCPGSLVYYGWGDTIWRFPDWKAHGPTDVRKAIAESCDVFFYVIGGGSDAYKISGLGIERIKSWASQFGFDRISGVDLPGEAKGLIPDPEWKEQVKGERWYIGDTYHISIGQGDILATPLQMANLTATIANGGTLYQPKVGYKILDEESQEEQEIKPTVIKKDFISPYNIEVVRQGMRDTVTYGSGRALRDLEVPVAGKTGTAQFGTEDKTHAWFTSFAPFKQPEIALAIIIEGGGDGDKVAVPVAKKVLEWYFKR